MSDTQSESIPPDTTTGSPFPLGATVRDGGVNFAVVADGPVSLSVFSGAGSERRIPMENRTRGIWHTWVPGVAAGLRYGYRAATDPAKVLLDPYARQVDRVDYDLVAAGTPGADTAGRAPLGVVTEPVSMATTQLNIPWEHAVIYEAHVKGLTAAHPDVPPAVRGTYLGAAHPAVVEHLVGLGITALQLLPIHAHAAEPHLAASGRNNYWGYSTLSFFALHPGYASVRGAERQEFATMVDALHDAGIEVICDVVYNHTCEGGVDQPITLSWRGLAPGDYYLSSGVDLTGTGNTIETGSLPTIRMVVDSLRYLADEFAIDGFRFDLASVLGRPGGAPFDPASGLLTAISADPVLRNRKLIAEPWDATADGYMLGRFGADYAEWNDRFRGTVRDFWRGATGVRDLAYRMAGSEDIFAGKQPWSSINFVTAHDGFTLRDVVSYRRKHNAANGEGGADGSDDHRSDNYGREGDGSADDPVAETIVAVRRRQARNLAATLLLSTGTPMITAGDEMWRTQGGNNNPYTIDSALTWLDWSAANDPTGHAADMVAFFRRVIAVRAAAPALHQGDFFSGRSPTDEVGDLTWFRSDGIPMTHDDWFDRDRRSIAAWFDGRDVRGHGPDGAPVTDDSWLIVAHAGAEATELTLPGLPYGDSYEMVIDTDHPRGKPADSALLPCGAVLHLPARTLWLLRAHRPGITVW